jgi:hypothetical protein
MHRSLITLAVACVAALSSTTAAAWGDDGHSLIGEYAQAHLSPAARAEVDKLLALEPGATLASIASWADEHRSPSTAPWHFVNFPRDSGCHYDEDRMCIDGKCVVDAIDRQLAVLKSTASPEQRLLALKYVVHFVGDVHQPLHAGYADDKGGNTYQVQAFGRGTNLHSLWDSGLIKNWPGGLDALRVAINAAPAQNSARPDPKAWAEQSCKLVDVSGFYPDGRKVAESYVTQWSATVPAQLAAAGQRLAMSLEYALAGAAR